MMIAVPVYGLSCGYKWSKDPHLNVPGLTLCKISTNIIYECTMYVVTMVTGLPINLRGRKFLPFRVQFETSSDVTSFSMFRYMV